MLLLLSELDLTVRLYKTGDEGGTLLHVTNNTDAHKDVDYASVTAKAPCYVSVMIDGIEIDGVYMAPGGSHSWWTAAQGKLLDRNGLDPGQTLEITADGPVAFRIDWQR